MTVGAPVLSMSLPAFLRRSATIRLTKGVPDTPNVAEVRAARQVNQAAATLAFAVLADSALEHYRGTFHNRAMYLPLISSALTLGFSLHGAADRRPAAHAARDAACLLATGIGVLGTGFHLYNVAKREGGLSWENLFYAAPVGAPNALALAGLLGLAAERLRKPQRGGARLMGCSAGRALAGLISAGLLGTAGEAGLLHFRGAFQDPFMFLPVTAPPIGAALLASSAARPRHRPLRLLARWALRLTAFLGFAGVGFHAYGVGRNSGGWRNWRQNVQNGPPLPAPPSFTGLAIAGLAALSLIAERDHG